MSVFVTGGGTGGHFFPALAVADALSKQGATCVYLGATDGIENILKQSIPCPFLLTPGLKRHTLRQKTLLLPHIVVSFFILLFYFTIKRPAAVLAAGGYVSLIPCILAKLFGIPLYLMEQNTVPGRVVQYFSSYATGVLSALPLVENVKTKNVSFEILGNPMSQQMLEFSSSKERVVKVKRLLIMGGSASASALDTAFSELAGRGILQGLTIQHIARPENKIELEAAYANSALDATVLPFCKNMAELYLKADLVICRAGASTLSELALFGIPAILVPYIYAVDNHQYHNASYIAERGAGFLCEQGDAFVDRLAAILTMLISDSEQIKKASIAMESLAMPNAANDIAKKIILNTSAT